MTLGEFIKDDPMYFVLVVWFLLVCLAGMVGAFVLMLSDPRV